MKHYRIVNKFRFISFITVCILLMVFAIGTLSGRFNARGEEEQTFTQVQVHYGDTLWALAGKYGPADQDIRYVVYEISRINNVDAYTLQPGQILQIPTSL